MMSRLRLRLPLRLQIRNRGDGGSGGRSQPRRSAVVASVLAASTGALLILLSSTEIDVVVDDYFSAPRSRSRRNLVSASTGADPTKNEKRRAALVRPFGTGNGPDLLRSFDLWDTLWPCSVSAAAGTAASAAAVAGSVGSGGSKYSIDLILSYSQTLDGDGGVRGAVDAARTKFESTGGWSGCLSSVRVVEAEIPPAEDRYDKGEEGEPADVGWVHGPNEQFRRMMREVMMTAEGDWDGDGDGWDGYDLAIVMEPDTIPRRVGWLDELMGEVQEKAPFAIMGSKYKGHAWDNIKDVIPHSLLEHINGNAVYNLTHPLMGAIVNELESERDTLFDAIPYDYRISQMMEEGAWGTPPEFPFPRMRITKNSHHDGNGDGDVNDSSNGDGDGPIVLPRKAEKFKVWWDRWGAEDPIKDSAIIANFGDTNYLEKNLGEEALVHGNNMFRPWDPSTHNISLLVSEWKDNLSKNLLSLLDDSDHPFSEVLVMVHPERFPSEVTESPSLPILGPILSFFDNLISGSSQRERHAALLPTSVPVRFVKRTSFDYLDLCDAPIVTDWFLHTNAFHRVAPGDLDIMFTNERPIPRPVIPYTPAASAVHCAGHDACRETLRLARTIHPPLDKVVLDMDMLYHTPSRDAFCRYWRDENGAHGQKLTRREGGVEAHVLRSVPQGPTATAYVAYLYRHGMADNLYAFANVLLHGTRNIFVKVHPEAEQESRRLVKKAMRGNSNGRSGRDGGGQGLEKKTLRGNGNGNGGGNGGGGGGGGDDNGRVGGSRGGPCTREGKETTRCGANINNRKVCCEGLVCDDNTGQCVQPPITVNPPGPYSGGRALGDLKLSAPGLLTEG